LILFVVQQKNLPCHKTMPLWCRFRSKTTANYQLYSWELTSFDRIRKYLFA